jgi:hypothetical protein
MQVVALVFALFGVGMLSAVLGGLSGSTFAKAFTINLSASLIITFFTVWFWGVGTYVIGKIRSWTRHPAPEPPALTEGLQEQRDRRVATVCLLLFICILLVVAISSWIGFVI